jgi:hypothetical protein
MQEEDEFDDIRPASARPTRKKVALTPAQMKRQAACTGECLRDCKEDCADPEIDPAGVLHAYSYTPTLTRLLLHAYSYTPALIRLLLHADPEIDPAGTVKALFRLY